MRKALIILLVAGALLTMLVVGAVAGGALAYFLTRTNPVQAAELGPETVQRLQSAPVDGGVLVSGVVEGSPAEAAGIVRGDIITTVGEKEVDTLAELQAAVEEQADENERVEITLQHGDEQRTVTVTLGDYVDQPRLGIEACGLFFGREMLPPQLRGEGSALPLDVSGALITEVIAGSPAESAGLQQGDIVTAVNDQEISADSSLADLIQSFQAGEEVTLTIQRDGETLERPVELAENPEDSSLPYLGIRYTAATGQGERVIPFDKLPFQLPDGSLPDGEGMPFFGHPFGDMPGMPFDLPEDVQSGAVVVDVTPGSPAEDAGLQMGDVIVSADEQAITAPQDLIDVVQGLEPGDELTLELYRSGQSAPMTVTVLLAENPGAAGQTYMGVRIGELMRMLEDSTAPGQGFFHNFPWPPSQDWSPLQEEPGTSA